MSKEHTYSTKMGLQIEDSSSLLLIDLGTLVKHGKRTADLAAFIGKRLATSEESFVDIFVDEHSNALAFSFEDTYGLTVEKIRDDTGKTIEIRIRPERK